MSAGVRARVRTELLEAADGRRLGIARWSARRDEWTFQPDTWAGPWFDLKGRKWKSRGELLEAVGLVDKAASFPADDSRAP